MTIRKCNSIHPTLGLSRDGQGGLLIDLKFRNFVIGRHPMSFIHFFGVYHPLARLPRFTWVHTGIAQSWPVHWGGQAQVPGATHHPPFIHATSHTGIRQSSPSSPPSTATAAATTPPPPDQSDGHVHVPGAVQLPPLPQVCEHTGTVQLGPNQPSAHMHASGAPQLPPCSHVWAQMGSRQEGAPVYPGMQPHSSGPTQSCDFYGCVYACVSLCGLGVRETEVPQEPRTTCRQRKGTYR